MDDATHPAAEEWRAVVGYEGQYEVSDRGRVRSLDREVRNTAAGSTRLSRGRVLSAALSAGYPLVNLSVGGEHFSAKVHWLVASAFLGERPTGALVCHTNGDRTDNRAENLRYDTWSGNNHDTVRHGNHWQASKTHCKHGHEFTPENTIPRSDGGRRRCRSCYLAQIERRKARNVAANA